MRRYSSPSLLLFLLCFFATGFSHWLLPYSSLSVPDSLYPAYVAIFVFSFIARLLARMSYRALLFCPAAGVAAAIMTRVIADTLSDPTSHNLWPLVLIIAGVCSIAVSCAAVLLAEAGRLIFRRN